MENQPIHIIITVDGGLVQSVFTDSSRPISIDVLDHDNWRVTSDPHEEAEFKRLQILTETDRYKKIY